MDTNASTSRTWGDYSADAASQMGRLFESAVNASDKPERAAAALFIFHAFAEAVELYYVNRCNPRDHLRQVDAYARAKAFWDAAVSYTRNMLELPFSAAPGDFGAAGQREAFTLALQVADEILGTSNRAMRRAAITDPDMVSIIPFDRRLPVWSAEMGKAFKGDRGGVLPAVADWAPSTVRREAEAAMAAMKRAEPLASLYAAMRRNAEPENWDDEEEDPSAKPSYLDSGALGVRLTMGCLAPAAEHGTGATGGSGGVQQAHSDPPSSTELAILRALAMFRTGVTVGRVSGASDISERTVGPALAKMRAKGWVRTQQKKTGFVITPKGREALDRASLP